MADYGLIIDNRKVATATTFDILNPATGELVAGLKIGRAHV